MKSILQTILIFFLSIGIIAFLNSININKKSNYPTRYKIRKWTGEFLKNERRKNIIPINDWKKYKVSENIEMPEKRSSEFSYPWYMVKHENGFENTLGEPIRERDTIKNYYNSWCYTYLEKEGRTFSDTLGRLPFCNFREYDDRLKIEIYDLTASNNESLFIELTGGEFKVDYQTSYVFPYEKIKWKIKEKELRLNQKLPIKRGSLLKGEVEVKVEETIFYQHPQPKSIRTKIIKGTFQLTIN